MKKTKKSKKSIFELIVGIFTWSVVLILVLVSFSLIASNFENPYGIKTFSVTSGSMEPSIHLGSFVVTKAENQYYENDIITFSKSGRIDDTTTHRITRVIIDDDLGIREYNTKGDANEDEDQGEVRNNLVIGKVIFAVPYFGYVTQFAKTQLGFVLLIVIPATVLIMHEFMNIKNEGIKIYKNKKSKDKKVDKVDNNEPKE